MKLVVMLTLLLSDADVFFTFASYLSYSKADFAIGPILISVMVFVYIGGAFYGNQQKHKFCKSLRLSVEAGRFKKQDGTTITTEDVKGLTENDFKTVMIREKIGNKFYAERSKFIRNLVKFKHSIPFLRLARFGWMADIPAGDFAGILNANALYTFTLGFPQMLICLFFWFKELDGEPDMIVGASLGISFLSFVLSMFNIIVSFPKVLNDLECARELELEKSKDIEAQIQGHVDGMMREREIELKRYIGKAAHTQDYIDTIKKFDKSIADVRVAVTDLVEKDFKRRSDLM